jgi:hypothetical protein
MAIKVIKKADKIKLSTVPVLKAKKVSTEKIVSGWVIETAANKETARANALQFWGKK